MDAKLKERLLKIIESTPYNLGQLEQIITLDLMAKAFDLDMGSEWVDVLVKQPQQDQHVITLNASGQVIPATYDYGEFKRYFDKCAKDRILYLTYDDVTHWMDLPQPPKEKEK